MNDKIGIKVNVGDRVVYTNGGKGDTQLSFGKIVSIDEMGENCMIVSDKGNKQRTPRYSDEILSLSAYKEAYPEYWL